MHRWPFSDKKFARKLFKLYDIDDGGSISRDEMADILTVIYKMDTKQDKKQKIELSRLQSIGSVGSGESADSETPEADSENNLKSKAEIKEMVIFECVTALTSRVHTVIVV